VGAGWLSNVSAASCAASLPPQALPRSRRHAAILRSHPCRIPDNCCLPRCHPHLAILLTATLARRDQLLWPMSSSALLPARRAAVKTARRVPEGISREPRSRLRPPLQTLREESGGGATSRRAQPAACRCALVVLVMIETFVTFEGEGRKEGVFARKESLTRAPLLKTVFSRAAGVA
jgi:hypothetical protein